MKFAQLWTSESTHELVQRLGTVGRAAPVVEASESEAELSAQLIDEGYEPFPDSGWAQVVVQWPMKSLAGTARDRWLLERAMEWVERHLDERGLGFADGFDRGRRMSPHEGWVQNLFLNVVDGPLASGAAMTCLRAARLDATRATIAHRQDAESDWIVQYDRKSNKIPGEFAL